MKQGISVGLVGAGLQGWRRARALSDAGGDRLVAVADVDLSAAERLAGQFGCRATERWQEVVEDPNAAAVLICTPPHLHTEMITAAVKLGKHVLCEKPLTHNLEAAKVVLSDAHRSGLTVKCGFNYRHHPGLRQAHAWVTEERIGDLMNIRCRHGIGGRPGYENEWRSQAEISGGGQLMDQGLHILDLFRWFLGDFVTASGLVSTSFWPIAPLEDNVFALLSTEGGQVASLHASWTQWRNLFSFEVYGRDGYISVDGLGGSYGTERVTLGKRAFLEPFREEITEFRGEDRSWLEEWQEFVSAIRSGHEPLGSGCDGLEAQILAGAIYESAKAGKVIRVAAGCSATASAVNEPS